METTIGLYKSELIDARPIAWASRQQVETSTTKWVKWFNQQRLRSSLEYLTPVEYEEADTQAQALQEQAA